MCVISFSFAKVAHDRTEHQSGTSKVGVFQFPYKGSRVFLIDTPGFDDTKRSDSEVLKDIAFWLAATYSKSVRLAGIIYLHRIIDPRMQGTALKNLRMFQKLCGDGNLGSVVLATTHWHNDEGGPAVTEKQGQERIKELIDRKDFWGGMVKHGSHVLKHDGSKASALNIVSMLVDQKIKVVLDIQRQMVEEHKNLDDTDAGQALRGELIAERKRFERKLKDLEADLTDAMHANDEAWRQEILREKAEFQAQIEKSDREREALQIDLKKIAEEKEAQYQELLNKMAEQERAHQAERDEQTRRMNEFQEQQRQRSEKEAKEKQELDAKYLKLEAQRRDDDARFREELLRTHGENEKRMLEAQQRAAEEKYEAEQRIQKERERANRERWEAAEARAQQDAEALRRENTRLAERQAYLERESKKSKHGFSLEVGKLVLGLAKATIEVFMFSQGLA
jgi:hypothetical protein